MRLAILSDIHDNLWNLAPAIEAMKSADALICCGDLCSPFVIDELAKFERDIHIVFGNNDADLYRITAKALKKPHCHVHGELFEATFEGKRVAVNHFDYLARPMAKSGNYDVSLLRTQSRIRNLAPGSLPANQPGTHHGR